MTTTWPQDPRLAATDGDPRFTAAEWRQREARRQCATWGHDWNIVRSFDGVPVALACDRACGEPRYSILPPHGGGVA